MLNFLSWRKKPNLTCGYPLGSPRAERLWVDGGDTGRRAAAKGVTWQEQFRYPTIVDAT